MVNNINDLLNELYELSDLFFMDKEKQAFAKLSELIKDINGTMTEFIEKIPEYNKQGANIPIDVVVAQLNNLVEGMKYKDTVMLGDCIKYELIESISLYKELMEN